MLRPIRPARRLAVLAVGLCAAAGAHASAQVPADTARRDSTARTSPPDSSLVAPVPVHRVTDAGAQLRAGSSLYRVRVITPVALPADSVARADTTIRGDTLVPADTTVRGDTLVPADTTVRGDTLVPVDTTVRADTLVPADTTVRADTLVPVDTTVLGDTLPRPGATVGGDSLVRSDTTHLGADSLVRRDSLGMPSGGTVARRQADTTDLGVRTSAITSTLYGGNPAWLIVSAGGRGGQMALDSLYLAQGDLRPLHLGGSLGLTRIAAEFAPDSLFAASSGPMGRRSLIAAIPPDAVVSVEQLVALLQVAPLQEGWSDSVHVVVIAPPTISADPGVVRVEGSERASTPLGPADCWLVVLRTGRGEQRLWVTKDSRTVVLARQALSDSPGGVVERSLIAWAPAVAAEPAAAPPTQPAVVVPPLPGPPSQARTPVPPSQTPTPVPPSQARIPVPASQIPLPAPPRPGSAGQTPMPSTP